MSTITATPPTTSNRILNALVRSEYEHLSPHLEPFRLEAGDVLSTWL